jgi:hypothetical protein
MPSIEGYSSDPCSCSTGSAQPFQLSLGLATPYSYYHASALRLS